MNRKLTHRALLAGLGAAVVLSACGSDDPAHLVASAKTYLDRKDSKDTKAAIIQLKNALQRQPDLPEARYLLGKAYLATGESAAALIELGRARDLKVADDLVAPEMARAMLTEQQEQRVVDKFAGLALSDRSAGADLKTTLASAYFALHDAANARASVDAAIALDPNHARALRMQSVLAAQSGDVDKALSLIDSLLVRAPKDVDALRTRGEFLQYGKHDIAAAAQAFRQALAVDPADVPSRVSLINTLLGQRDLDGASKEIQILRQAKPRDLQTAYFEAQLAFFKGDLKRAHQITDELARLSPESVQVRQLAGAVELQLGLLFEAERSFLQALQRNDNLPTARRMLAQTYLRLGQPSKALNTLEPLLAGDSRDTEAMLVAAEANLQSGNLGQADANYARVAALDPGNTSASVALALSDFGKGRQAEAIARLEALASVDKTPYTNFTLAGLFIRGKDYDSASKQIDAIEAKLPGKPLTAHLRARLDLARNEPMAARSHFERALAIDPAFVPAAAALASLDLADKHPDAAAGRFEGVLKADPKNVDALMALAGLKARAVAPHEEVVALLQRAVASDPTALPPRLALVDDSLDRGDLKTAATAAQAAVAALPNRPEAWDALGRVLFAGGETNQAVAAFNKLAAIDTTSPTPFLRIAAVQRALKDSDAEIQSLKRALAIRPDSLEAQRLLVAALISEKRPTEALTIARTVGKQRQNSPEGSLLEASVEASRNNTAAAVDIYRATLKRFPLPDVASRLYTALLTAGKGAEAAQFASSWISAHPGDAAMNFAVAEAALTKRDYSVAETRFREVLDAAPDNAAAANNLAFVLATMGKSGAVALATKATALAPRSAEMWDTLGLALATEKRFPEAITAQVKAVQLAPVHSVYRLNLARFYLLKGDKEKARTEVDSASRAADRAEVEAQIDELNRKL